MDTITTASHPDGGFRIMAAGPRRLATASVAERRYIYNWVVRQLEGSLGNHGERLSVVSGMAEGFDECVTVAAQRLGIPVLAVVPTPSYGRYYWGRNSVTGRDRAAAFGALLARASEVRYVSARVWVYTDGKRQHANFARNDEMIALSNGALVLPSTSPGTTHAIVSLTEAGVPIKWARVD